METSSNFMPFHELKEVTVFNSAIKAMFAWHWDRVLKDRVFNCNPPLQETLNELRFYRFWKDIVEEICVVGYDTSDISLETNIAQELLGNLRLGSNYYNTKISIEDAKKLLSLHKKVRPDLQPSTTKKELV
jgi:hypothetical protein